MMPGQPVDLWSFERSAEGGAASAAADVGRVFDEQDRAGALSREAWDILCHLAITVSDAETGEDAVQWGTFVCRPDPEHFDPSELEGHISEKRLKALLDGRTAPTRKEITEWQELQIERAFNDGALGLYTAFGWSVEDDRGRERVLVTLHVDANSLERVAGLYRSVEEAATALSAYGRFEWLW